jgi:hypothetical protein
MRIEHDAAQHRFMAHVNEGPAEGVLVYARTGTDQLDLQHTAVTESQHGQGVGEALVRAALDYARENKLRIIPTCPYVRAWLKRHPGQADLVA